MSFFVGSGRARGHPRPSRRDLWGGFGMNLAQDVVPRGGIPPRKVLPQAAEFVLVTWIPESACFRDFRCSVLRTGVPEILKVHCFRCTTFCSAHRSPKFPESPFLIFPTSCSAHRSPRIPESALLRFLTSCSAHRSPRIIESAIVEISDVLFCAQESQNS